ncbi:MAG TPA: EF-hand domain-containing protein [Sphingomonas sp.]|uniref:EF-hand domain-containing protein n=1 Tax=Sphingomonas sp. TaxID=28214 RepID=UPI002ED8A1C2
MKTLLTTVAVFAMTGSATAQMAAPANPDFLPRAAAEDRATGLNRMLDTDRDGVVTRLEVDRWAAGKSIPPGMIDSMFTDADTDHDGRITLAEQKADALRSFDEADTDHDGRMTAAERDAAERKYGSPEDAAPKR